MLNRSSITDISSQSSGNNKRESIMATDDSSAKSGPQKRSKQQQQQPYQDPFDLLTDDAALSPIFEFIGPYHFRFIAGVNRRFRRLYTQFQQQEYRKRVPNPEDFEKLVSTSLTSAASIAESISLAEIVLSDTKKSNGRHVFLLINRQEIESQVLVCFGSYNPLYFSEILWRSDMLD